MRTMMSGSRKLRGQGAFEFMLIFGIFLGALIVTTVVSWYKVMEVNRNQKQLEIDSLLETVMGKIDTVWLEGSGFSTNVTLPKKITNMDYTINVTSKLLYIKIGEEYYAKSIVMENVTGNFTTGAVNTLYNKGNYILITNGTV